MRAVSFSAFGGPEVLEIIDAPVPEPGPGRIRVAVRAAGVNGYDWKLRRGLMGGNLPKRVGLEFAGVVDARGDDVTDVSVGDAVFGFAIGGAEADFTLSARYWSIPGGLDFIHAAALPVAAETAYRVLDAVGVSQGSTVLISGASGGVGQAAVQIARARGARVLGTASAANQAFLASLGAEPLLYGEGLAERVAALGVERVDAAVDIAGAGGLADLVTLTGTSDHVVTIADMGADQLGVRFSDGVADRADHALASVSDLIAAGRFSVTVEETFPLEQVAAAYARSEQGHARGKLVLTL